MATQKIVVCRTHFLDDRLVDFARSVHGTDGYRVVFAVDETHGSVETREFEKISLTREAFAPLGLFTGIGDIFWRCGDYPLYLARLRFPECSTFWLCEYDVAINRAEPISFFQEMDAAHDHDFLATHFRRPEEWWSFRHAMTARYAEVWRSYFPLVRLSGRALDFAMAERAAASAEMELIPPERRPEWANDEAFVATVLQNNGFRCADYNDLGTYYTDRTFWMTVLLHPTALPPHDGLIYHCVRTGKQYLKIVTRNWCIIPLPEPSELLRLVGHDWTADAIENPLKETILARLEGVGDNPDRVMADGGVVAQVVARNAEPAILRSVVLALAEARMPECLRVLRHWQVRRWWPHVDLLDNVALARPAWQSSVSHWSAAGGPRADAEGGNNGQLHQNFGFHTGFEEKPWWTVDLQQVHLLSQIRIHNSRTHRERLNGFRLLASLDGHDWRVVHRSPDGVDFAATADSPVRIDLHEAARFLRVQVPHTDYLHFREFEAYGTAFGP